MNIQIQKADARNLRSELDATIQIPRAADARAKLAKETADRAEGGAHRARAESTAARQSGEASAQAHGIPRLR